MSLVFEPVNRYKHINWPSDDTANVGGGIDVAAPISDNVVGFIPTQPIPSTGEGDLDWYYPEAHRVENGTADPMPAPGWWRPDGLLSPAVAGVFSLVAADPADTGKVKVNFINNSSGLWDSDVITLDGTNAVLGILPAEIGTPVFAESVNTGEDALELAVSDRWISRGILLGKIPEGRKTADGLHWLAMATSVNNTYDNADRLTDPHVASPANVGAFSQPYTAATMIQLPAAIDVEDTEYAVPWWRIWAYEDMVEPIDVIVPMLAIRVVV